MIRGNLDVQRVPLAFMARNLLFTPRNVCALALLLLLLHNKMVEIANKVVDLVLKN
jgi:hypothetical protein